MATGLPPIRIEMGTRTSDRGTSKINTRETTESMEGTTGTAGITEETLTITTTTGTVIEEEEVVAMEEIETTIDTS